jgi:hypothetical protein
MLNRKRINDNKTNGITINTLIINAALKKRLLMNNYNKISNFYSRNRYNLNLIPQPEKNYELNLKRKLTKMGLLNNLYHKYSSVSNNINSNTNTNTNIKNTSSQTKEKT